MTDQPADAPPQRQPLHNYKVSCLNGWQVNCASPHDLPTFTKFAMADGGIPSDKMFIVWQNIISIEHIGMFVPNGQTVAPLFGPRPVP
jgi:hypothetical protein